MKGRNLSSTLLTSESTSTNSAGLGWLGPVVGGLSVCVEVEDDGAGEGLVSMGCDAVAHLVEEEDGNMEEEE